MAGTSFRKLGLREWRLGLRTGATELNGRRGLAPLEEWQRAFVLYFVPLIYFASLARSGTVMVDGDTYLHVAAGQWIIEHKQFIHTDFFSYTFAGARWSDPEWLSEVAMAAAYALAAWSGVALLFSVAFGLTALLIAQRLLKHLNPLPAFIVLELSNYCIASGESSRPYALALPILAAWTGSLLAARSENRAPRIWLLPLMTLWANVHGSFLFGIALIAPFAAEAVFQKTGDKRRVLRDWFLFAAGAIAAASINPNGVEALTDAASFLMNPILPSISDWQSTTFSRASPFEIALLALIAACIVWPIRVPLFRLLLLLLLIHMALSHRRHVRIFAVVAPMLLSEPLSVALGREIVAKVRELFVARLSAALGVACFLVVVVVRLALPNRQDNAYSPAEALSRIPPAVATQHVLNEDVLGGFLIFHHIKPFIDTRVELFTDAFHENIDLMSKPDRAAIIRTLAHYDIGWTILRPDNPVNSVLDTLPGWRILYADKGTVIHTRAVVGRASSRAD